MIILWCMYLEYGYPFNFMLLRGERHHWIVVIQWQRDFMLGWMNGHMSTALWTYYLDHSTWPISILCVQNATQILSCYPKVWLGYNSSSHQFDFMLEGYDALPCTFFCLWQKNSFASLTLAACEGVCMRFPMTNLIREVEWRSMFCMLGLIEPSWISIRLGEGHWRISPHSVGPTQRVIKGSLVGNIILPFANGLKHLNAQHMFHLIGSPLTKIRLAW